MAKKKDTLIDEAKKIKEDLDELKRKQKEGLIPSPPPFNEEDDEEFDGFKTVNYDGEELHGQWITSPGNVFQAILDGNIFTEDSDGNEEASGAMVALVQNMHVYWKKNFPEVEQVKLADDGTCVVSHYPIRDYSTMSNNPEPGKDLGGTVDVFDKNGDVIYSQIFTSNIGSVEISYNAKYLLISTLYPDSSIHCIDFSEKKEIWTYANQARRQVTRLKLLNNIIHVYCGRSSAEEELAFHLNLDGTLDKKESQRQERLDKILQKTNVNEQVDDFLLLLNTEKTFELTSVLNELFTLCSKAKKSHEKILKNILPLLDPSNDELFRTGWSVVRSIMSKSPELFEKHATTVLKILKMPVVEENSRLFYYQHMAHFIPKSLEGEIQYLKNIVNHGEDWNDRRFAISVIGILGSKNPDLVREFVPILIDYVSSSERIDQLTEMNKKGDSVNISPDLSIKIEIEGDAEDAEWVRHASIDALADIGSADPNLVKECIPLLKELAKKSTNQYTKKKAKQALDKINKK